LGLLALLALCGCRPAAPEDSAAQAESESSAAHDDQLFQIAIRNLNQLEDYNGNEMLRPALDRLNHWASHQQPPAGWKPDPMLQTLPAPLRELAVVKALDALEFRRDLPPDDGWTLQEAIWLRDLSGWARGSSFDPLEQAKRLFDWTVRNVQLEPERAAAGVPWVAIQRPWETLLLGRGTAVDRSWVFLLLARQQRLDAAALAVADPGDPERPQFLPGLVVVLHKGQLYLFDLGLGLPIPGPGGITRDAHGRLDIRPATLAEVVADDGLLRQLDASRELAYPLKSSQLQKVTILLDASPASLSRRMKLLESRLVGADALRITADPSAQARLFRKCEHVADVQLWQVPYMTILEEMQNPQARAQWQGMMLFPFMAEFKAPARLQRENAADDPDSTLRERLAKLRIASQGRDTDDPDAATRGKLAKPKDASQEKGEADDAEADSRGQSSGWVAALWKGRIYHIKGRLTGSPNAVQCYQLARGSERDLSTVKNKEILVTYLWAKLDASYWLGLVEAAQDNLLSAEDYFKNRTLNALPESFWAGGLRFDWNRGATYNLGRVYEASGEPQKAIDLYRTEVQPQAPDRQGNLLRARWLESLLAVPLPTHSPEGGDGPHAPQR
jgi:hypothetical protein